VKWNFFFLAATFEWFPLFTKTYVEYKKKKEQDGKCIHSLSE
jgi:hypothetical protein